MPTPPNPVSAEDFECGELPSGKLVFQPAEVESDTIYFGSLPKHTQHSWRNKGPLDYAIDLILDLLRPNRFFGLKNDGIKEGWEYFTIQLYDLDTGKDIPADFAEDDVFSVSDSSAPDEKK